MRCHIDEIMLKTQFPPEAHDFFLRFYDMVYPLFQSEFEKLSGQYLAASDDADICRDINLYVTGRLKEISDYYGYNPGCVQMLFLLYCTKELHERYRIKGLSDEIFYATITDIRYKAIECKKYSGVWGCMNFPWFHRHFLTNLFALGRFQYEYIPFAQESYDFGDVHVKKGDRVVNIHIPSSGPMGDCERLDSYKRAYEFFGGKNKGNIVFVCNSWLLYPDMDKIYPTDSNLNRFFNEFDIIDSYVHPYHAFSNAWRVFYKDFEGDVSVFSQNTTLEKNIASWLSAGNKIGSGYGVMVFDGEKIINRK